MAAPALFPAALQPAAHHARPALPLASALVARLVAGLTLGLLRLFSRGLRAYTNLALARLLIGVAKASSYWGWPWLPGLGGYDRFVSPSLQGLLLSWFV